MNKIIKQESAVKLFGINARAFGVVANTETGRILNQKIGTSKEYKEYKEGGARYRISVDLSFDDQCGNGHETFSITGSINEWRNGHYREFSCGCLHDEISKHFPELAHLIKWHLVSTDGPMHYIANTCYHAGDKDCNGLAKGEKRQIINGRSGEPAWQLVAIDSNGEELQLYKLEKNIDGVIKPECAYTLEYRPWCRIGEGKERELDFARESAVWLDATDEQLSAPRAELEEALKARLPALLEEFKATMLSCGFVWPEGE